MSDNMKWLNTQFHVPPRDVSLLFKRKDGVYLVAKKLGAKTSSYIVQTPDRQRFFSKVLTHFTPIEAPED